jgi:hypothetical protein
LSARKAVGANTEGSAPFLQLPHFTESTIKKISRKVPSNFTFPFHSLRHTSIEIFLAGLIAENSHIPRIP